MSSDASLAHVELSGTLADYEVIGISKKRTSTLRLRLEGNPQEFRVDPSLFNSTMYSIVPTTFRNETPVTLLVIAEQYARPSRPVFNEEVEIVWVHGLKVDGSVIFWIEDVFRTERRNRIWGYALLVTTLMLANYLGLKWRRSVHRREPR
jgi:hypothetical protein